MLVVDIEVGGIVGVVAVAYQATVGWVDFEVVVPVACCYFVVGQELAETLVDLVGSEVVVVVVRCYCVLGPGFVAVPMVVGLLLECNRKLVWKVHQLELVAAKQELGLDWSLVVVATEVVDFGS